MKFTQEEIKNLEALLLSPQEENVRLAFAILEGKEYPEDIKILFNEYKELYEGLFSDKITSLEEICLKINQADFIGINRDSIEIGLLKKLEHIFYYDCPYASLPSVLGKLTSLKGIFLSGDNLYKVNFAVFKVLKNLKKIQLVKAGLTYIPDSIKTVTDLEEIDLSANNFFKNNLLSLIFFKNLRKLSLRHCSLNHIPIVLSKLIHLEDIDLSGNYLSEANFLPILNLKKLRKIRLVDCNLLDTPAALLDKNIEVEIHILPGTVL